MNGAALSGDLQSIAAAIKNGARYGQAELSLWGGVCTAAQLPAWLAQWNLTGLNNRYWEQVSRAEFSATLPDAQDVALLERARLFGAGGDLSLRRTGDDFHWLWIGPRGTQPPNPAAAQNFWVAPAHAGASFHRVEETALLWGEHKNGQPVTPQGAPLWFDDRVARAWLNYPAPATWLRVQLRYWAFSRAGRIEFVWLRGLEKY